MFDVVGWYLFKDIGNGRPTSNKGRFFSTGTEEVTVLWVKVQASNKQ